MELNGPVSIRSCCASAPKCQMSRNFIQILGNFIEILRNFFKCYAILYNYFDHLSYYQIGLRRGLVSTSKNNDIDESEALLFRNYKANFI